MRWLDRSLAVVIALAGADTARAQVIGPHIPAPPSHVLSASVDIDPVRRTVVWTIRFDEPPAFWEFDGAQRQKHALTIDVWSDAAPSRRAPGDEDRRIYTNWRWDVGLESQLSVTTSRNLGTRVLDTIEFVLSDTTIRFETSFDHLDWNGRAGLTAKLETYRYGRRDGQERYVLIDPEPGYSAWTVTNLTPTGALLSVAAGVNAGQQIGFTLMGGAARASLWNGSAASWVDLTPPSATSSDGRGIHGGSQVGSVLIQGLSRASLWRDGAWVDLHPAQATGGSWAEDVHGGQQVGYVSIGGQTHASAWVGSSQSWIDLHPSGANRSEAFGVHGGEIVGSVWMGNQEQASLWRDGALVNLHPYGAASSRAVDAHSGVQVGRIDLGTGERAALWRGRASSWRDLHPGEAELSFVDSAHGDWQVGAARFEGELHASVWNGSAGSWEDLHDALVSGSWSGSTAHGVWTDGAALHVVGEAGNSATGRIEALLWSRPLSISRYADCDVDRELSIFDFLCFQDAFLRQNPYADCDGNAMYDVFDFLCFQDAFLNETP